MKCHSMKRNFINFKNQINHMPLHNRSQFQIKRKNDEDIALSTHRKQFFLEKEIKFDDSLQSVALEFNVPVSELKRINNIHKDNEIFARKVIKVPAHPLSILLEKDYFSEKKELAQENSNKSQENCDVIVEVIKNSTYISNDNYKTSQEDEKEREMEELGKLGIHTAAIAEEDQESASLLATTMSSHKANDMMSCNGADWGLSWHALLLVTLMLGLGGPVFYVIWLIFSKKGKLEGS